MLVSVTRQRASSRAAILGFISIIVPMPKLNANSDLLATLTDCAGAAPTGGPLTSGWVTVQPKPRTKYGHIFGFGAGEETRKLRSYSSMVTLPASKFGTAEPTGAVLALRSEPLRV